LRREAHLTDLVEEDRALVGELEAALSHGHRAGERPLLVTEQLGLEQRLRERGARDLHHRPAAAIRVVVERLRDELFSGAALAGDEDGRVRLRDLADGLVHLLHRRGVADDALGLHERADLVAQHFDLLGEILVIEGALHRVRDLVELERLGDVVERPELHGLDRGV
jgi:hypothetical protein